MKYFTILMAAVFFSLLNSAQTHSQASVFASDVCNEHLPKKEVKNANESDDLTVITDKFGAFIYTPENFIFDENDRLKVYLVADKSYAENLRISRTSTTRDSSIVRYIGGDSPGPAVSGGATPASNSIICNGPYYLTDFSPGEGVVQYQTFKDQQSIFTDVGGFKLKVNPLYSGIFSLGYIETDLTENDFKLATSGSDQVIVNGNAGEKDNLYGLFYTPFIWGKRDLEAPFTWKRIYERINPTLGVSLEDISDHALIGITIDLPGQILLTYGRHYGKIESLTSSSGLSEGDIFTGQLPTTESWEHDDFIALSFDIKAIQKLFGFQTSKP